MSESKPNPSIHRAAQKAAQPAELYVRPLLKPFAQHFTVSPAPTFYLCIHYPLKPLLNTSVR
jgi:hypothetical protein